MPRVTLSYRRDDSAGIARLIFERLRPRYGADSVFMDIDSIEFGEDYRERIHHALRSTDYLLVLIGPRWLGPLGNGQYRINELNDPVRMEVERALEIGLRVVPILLEHTQMPGPGELPGTLSKLPYLNAADVTAGREFDSQIERLVRFIDRTFAETEARRAREMQEHEQELRDPAPPSADAPKATPSQLVVSYSPVGPKIVPGGGLTFSYQTLADQIDDEQVDLVDALNDASPVEVHDRQRDETAISARIDVPASARPGSKWRLRVTTWDDSGAPRVGVSTPFTITSPAPEPVTAPQPGPQSSSRGPARVALPIGAAILMAAIVALGYFLWPKSNPEVAVAPVIAVRSPAPVAPSPHHTAPRVPRPAKKPSPRPSPHPSPSPKATAKATPLPHITSAPKHIAPAPKVAFHPRSPPAAVAQAVPARGFDAIPAGFVVMYDGLPGVFWRALDCQQVGSDARVGFSIYNDYTQRMYYDIALTGHAGSILPSDWLPTRYYIEPRSQSVEFSHTLSGFTCAGATTYSGLRNVRFGEDSGPYVRL